MKIRRRAVLFELVESGVVGSQAAAVEALAQRGIVATQATVSRDLDDLGAVKIRDGGGVRYAIGVAGDGPPAGSPYGISLPRVLNDFIVGEYASGPIAVLKTPPGHAAMVAAAVDRAHLAGVVGSIAGDDTIFVCADETVGGAGILRELERQRIGDDTAAAPILNSPLMTPPASGRSGPGSAHQRILLDEMKEDRP